MSRENPLAVRQNLSLDDLKYETFLKCEGIYISRSWSYIEEACRRHGFTPKTRSRHCASIAELFTLCANLGSTVLVIGCNFGNRIPAGIQQFCHTVPIEDDDATIPLYLLFRGDNANPVLREAASRIKEMPQPAISFS